MKMIIFGSKESLSLIDKFSKKNLLAKAKSVPEIKGLLNEKKILDKRIKDKIAELIKIYIEDLYKTK